MERSRALLACADCHYTGSTHGTSLYVAERGIGSPCPNCGKGIIAEFTTDRGAVSALERIARHVPTADRPSKDYTELQVIATDALTHLGGQ